MKKLLFVLLALLPGLIASASDAGTNRPSARAVPIALNGVPNLHKVSDTLYRSAQPTVVGMQNLKKLGIKTIINALNPNGFTGGTKPTNSNGIM